MTLSLSQTKEIRTWTKRLMVNPVTVETYLGDSAYGAKFASPRTVNCLVLSRRVLSPDGSSVVDELSLTVDEEDSVYFTPESRLTVFGKPSHVVSTKPVMYGDNTVFTKVVCS